jgi:DSF synthase
MLTNSTAISNFFSEELNSNTGGLKECAPTPLAPLFRRVETTPAILPEAPRPASILDRQFRELDLDFDKTHGVCWIRFRFTDRPSFTPEVLQELRRVRQMLAAMAAGADPEAPPVKYVVLGSRMPGVFNLGGDLSLFASLIRQKDRDGLMRYARACVEGVYANSVGLDLPVITVSLVQGDALGGGFEAALSSNLLIAERSAKFGLPEILFNLFPGMGAYSFIARRTSAATAERMIMSGRVYTGAELYDMGLVDVLAEDGCGEEEFYNYVKKNARRHMAHRSIYQARQRVNPVTLQELLDITRTWVDTALSLGESDLKIMDRLVSAQNRRRVKTDVADAATDAAD